MPTKKEVEDYARSLNPIDDIMFHKMAEHKEFCEEILRVILEDDKLTVKEAIPQWSGKNLKGRSVVLDAKCLTGDGRNINIEVQKENNDNHLKRVRYNGAILTTNIAKRRKKFKFIPDVCIIFISKFDIFKGGLPIYHVDKVVRETGELINDGLTEIFINVTSRNDSKVSKLMELFIKDDAYNTDAFPITSEIKARFKSSVGGRKEMNEMLEKMFKEEKKEIRKRGIKLGEKRGIKLGEKRGSENEKIRIAKDMKKMSLPSSLIAELTGLSEKKILTL